MVTWGLAQPTLGCRTTGEGARDPVATGLALALRSEHNLWLALAPSISKKQRILKKYNKQKHVWERGGDGAVAGGWGSGPVASQRGDHR